MNEIIFYTDKKDWRKEVKYIDKDKYNKNEMDLVDIAEEELKKINEVFNREKYYVDVIYNNTKRRIKKEEFNPLKMKIVYKTKEELEKIQKNLKDMIDSQQAPGIIINLNPTPGVTNSKGYIDEGAMGNLLDIGLDGAKKRAIERQKKYGYSFRKSNLNRTRLKRRRKK